MVSESKRKANAKWDAANYDRVMVRLPKGSKERILALGETLNGYISRLVVAQLERDEQSKS